MAPTMPSALCFMETGAAAQLWQLLDHADKMSEAAHAIGMPPSGLTEGRRLHSIRLQSLQCLLCCLWISGSSAKPPPLHHHLQLHHQ